MTGAPWWLYYLVLLAIAQLVFWRTAWIADDALITLRSALNFEAGFGPVYNLGERVQGFTHATWFGLLVGLLALGNEPFAALFTLSLVVNLVTMLALAVLLREFAVPVLFTWLLSKGFIDFANSGLENPLTYLLLVLTACALRLRDQRQRALVSGLCCGALIMTRPDLGLMLIAVLVVNRSARFWFWFMLGLLPLMLWLSVSLYYFGTFLPNTAFAKLGTGLPRIELLLQGLVYLATVVVHDPLAVALTVLFLILAVRGRAARELFVFVAMFIGYTIFVGGDFMGSRFFAVPFVAGTLGLGLLRQAGQLPPVGRSLWLVAALGLAPFSVYDNFLAGSRFDQREWWFGGVADERGYYFQEFGLSAGALGTVPDVSDWRERAGETVSVHEVCGGMGIAGIELGPAAHMLDTCALVDPLLARLPMDYPGFMRWRIGHFYREIPENYPALLLGLSDQLPHAPTQRLLEDIHLATRAPLKSTGRAMAIWRLHTFDYGITSEKNVE